MKKIAEFIVTAGELQNDKKNITKLLSLLTKCDSIDKKITAYLKKQKTWTIESKTSHSMYSSVENNEQEPYVFVEYRVKTEKGQFIPEKNRKELEKLGATKITTAGQIWIQSK